MNRTSDRSFGAAPIADRSRNWRATSLAIVAALAASLPSGAGAPPPQAHSPARVSLGSRQNVAPRPAAARAVSQGSAVGVVENPQFATGTVTGVNPSRGTIVVSSPSGGPRTIRVTAMTRVFSRSIVSVGDLRLNDRVQVFGAAAAIDVSSMVVGEIPAFLPGGRAMGSAGQTAGTDSVRTTDSTAVAPSREGSRSQALVSASGTVVALNPLTIAMSNDVTIIVKLDRDVKVTRVLPGSVSSIRAGDMIEAPGYTADDGTFNAAGIGINFNAEGGARERSAR